MKSESTAVEAFAGARLQGLTASQLVAHLDRMRAHEQEQIVEYLRYLAEVDRRDVGLELGFPSLWAFCVEHQRLSNGAAYRRITASRLLTRFPVIADFLASGQLCLTTLCLLKDVLDEPTHVEVLDRAAGRTEDQVKLMVATLRPQEAPRDLLQRLPTPEQAAVPVTSGPEVTSVVAATSGPEGAFAPEPSRQPDRVRPISAEQYVLRVTIGPECRSELEQVIKALSHKVPSGNLEAVLRECFQTTLKACARRRGAVTRPRAQPTKSTATSDPHAQPTRYIPAAVRREVWRRDEGKCTFVGSDGRRCGSQHQVELDHHEVPFAAGGEPTVENLTLRCRPHNQLRARQYYGTTFMARFGATQTG